jgi:hypothetical protein
VNVSYSDQLTVYDHIRHRARQIVSQFPLPSFYTVHAHDISLSQIVFSFDPLIHQVYRFAAERLEDDFGHGMDHAVKVTIDAGALMAIEGRHAGYSSSMLDHRIRIVQCAGLLHDIRRKSKNHAVEGARYARHILKSFRLSVNDIEDIAQAILNHEAFRETIEINTLEGRLISDCLYDADKFRWGPDNFTDTLWDMLRYINPPIQEFIGRFPDGMKVLANIRKTFRTQTGKRFGPEFIDMGIRIGTKLFSVLKHEFSSDADPTISRQTLKQTNSL